MVHVGCRYYTASAEASRPPSFRDSGDECFFAWIPSAIVANMYIIVLLFRSISLSTGLAIKQLNPRRPSALIKTFAFALKRNLQQNGKVVSCCIHLVPARVDAVAL